MKGYLMSKFSKLLLFITLFGATNQTLSNPEGPKVLWSERAPEGNVLVKTSDKLEVRKATSTEINARSQELKMHYKDCVLIAGAVLATTLTHSLLKRAYHFFTDSKCEYKEFPNEENTIIARIHHGGRLKFYNAKTNAIIPNLITSRLIDCDTLRNVTSVKWYQDNSCRVYCKDRLGFEVSFKLDYYNNRTPVGYTYNSLVYNSVSDSKVITIAGSIILAIVSMIKYAEL